MYVHPKFSNPTKHNSEQILNTISVYAKKTKTKKTTTALLLP